MAASATILTLRFRIDKFKDPESADLGVLAKTLFKQYGCHCAEVLEYDGPCEALLDRLYEATGDIDSASGNIDWSGPEFAPCSPTPSDDEDEVSQFTAKPAAAAAIASPNPLKRPSLPPMLPDQDQDQPPKKKAAIEHIDLTDDTSSEEEEDIECDVSSSEEEEQEEGEMCPHCGDPSDKFVNLSSDEKKCTDFPDYAKLCPECAYGCWETVGACHRCDKICGLIPEQDWQGTLHTERLTDVPTQKGDMPACESCYEIIQNYKNRELGLWQTHLPNYTVKHCSRCNEDTLAIQCNRLEERIACVECLETYE